MQYFRFIYLIIRLLNVNSCFYVIRAAKPDIGCQDFEKTAKESQRLAEGRMPVLEWDKLLIKSIFVLKK